MPGKAKVWREAMAELKGPRGREHEEARRRVGITREFVCLQETPIGHLAVVYLEGPDPMSSVRRYIDNPDHPFDQWFLENVLKKCHGVKDSDPVPSPEVFVDMDLRRAEERAA
jgi:hypothetical protein